MVSDDPASPSITDPTLPPSSSAADEECSKVGRVEWICDATFWRRARGRQRGLPAELADFAAELTGAASCEEQFSSQPVPTSCDDAAFGDEPHAGVAVADIEDLFTSFEAPCRAARKANGKLQLTGRQRWKELRLPIFQ